MKNKILLVLMGGLSIFSCHRANAMKKLVTKEELRQEELFDLQVKVDQFLTEDKIDDIKKLVFSESYENAKNIIEYMFNLSKYVHRTDEWHKNSLNILIVFLKREDISEKIGKELMQNFYFVSTAVNLNMSKALELFLQKGADPAGRLLYDAAQKGYPEIVKILISYGADVDDGSKGIGSFVPLAGAVLNGHTSVVDVLMANNADVVPAIKHLLMVNYGDIAYIAKLLYHEQYEAKKEDINIFISLANSMKKHSNDVIEGIRVKGELDKKMENEIMEREKNIVRLNEIIKMFEGFEVTQ